MLNKEKLFAAALCLAVVPFINAVGTHPTSSDVEEYTDWLMIKNPSTDLEGSLEHSSGNVLSRNVCEPFFTTSIGQPPINTGFNST